MKTSLFALMLLSFGLISCNPKAAKEKSDNLFRQGLAEMSKIQHDSLDHDFSPAIMLFSQAIEQDTKNFAAQYWKMNCEMRMNKLEDAKTTFEKALKNGLKDEDKLAPAFYVSAGLIDKTKKIVSTENFDKAIKIYSKRIEQDKNDYDAIANKTLICLYIDKKAEAIAFVDSLIAKGDSASILLSFRKGLIDFNPEKALDKMFVN